MTTVTISPTGRITIPRRISRRMSWEPRTHLDVLIRDAEIALRPRLTNKEAPTALSSAIAPSGRIIATGHLREKARLGARH